MHAFKLENTRPPDVSRDERSGVAGFQHISVGLERVFGLLNEVCAVSDQAPRDLEWLGVDRPYWRWNEARKYIRELRTAALRQVRSLTRETLVLLRAKRSWLRRGKPGSGPDRTDVADAVEWFKTTFVDVASGDS